MSLLIFILFIGIFNQYTNGNPEDVQFPLNNIPPAVKSVVCDGRNSSCSNTETCCQLQSGQYGCCPHSGAVCCSDQLHCCPKGYTCDVEHSRCQKQSEETSGVLCPGGEMTCADGETCYQLESGDYGCCQFPDALLCDDYIHCCPNRYVCNSEQKKCENDVFIPWFTNKKATSLNLPSKLILPPLSSSHSLSTVECSDKKSVCSNDSTCCQLNNSTYGCCPFPRGSCCADKMHCCQEGHSCDKSGLKCIPDVRLTRLSTLEEQTCPDGITKCSTSSTCCPDKNNDKTTYICCPYARGTCCGSNGLCCPHKYTCDEDRLNDTANSTSGSSNLICLYNFDISPPGAYACAAGQVLCPSGSCCRPGACKPGVGCF